MASLIPKFVKSDIVTAWIAAMTGTTKLMLLTNLHTPNASTQQYIADVVANQVVASGDYVAGGHAVTLVATPTPDPAATNNYFLDASDVVIGPNTTLTFKYGVLYNTANNKILAQIDFGAVDQAVVNGTSTIQWAALGIIYVS